jgi:hypothetical protein
VSDEFRDACDEEAANCLPPTLRAFCDVTGYELRDMRPGLEESESWWLDVNAAIIGRIDPNTEDGHRLAQALEAAAAAPRLLQQIDRANQVLDAAGAPAGTLCDRIGWLEQRAEPGRGV